MNHTPDTPPADQQGFWTPQWQCGEAQADAQIAAGGLPVYDDMATLFAAIDAEPDTDTDTPGREIPVPEATIAALNAARTRFNARRAADTEDGDLFDDVAAITAWLDAANPPGPHEDAMRVLKLAEESGEAAAAYIGMVGQNPRKGVTHTLSDVLGELADVALTALCAIQHFTGNHQATREIVNAKASGVAVRARLARTHP